MIIFLRHFFCNLLASSEKGSFIAFQFNHKISQIILLLRIISAMLASALLQMRLTAKEDPHQLTEGRWIDLRGFMAPRHLFYLFGECEEERSEDEPAICRHRATEATLLRLW